MTTFFRKALLLVSVVFVQAAAVNAQTYTDGLTAMQLKDWDKAISIFSAITQANAADQNALLSLGNAYLAKGDKEKALATFKLAYAAKPEGAMAYIALGRIQLLENKIADADKQFERAERAARKDMNARRQIGESYLFYTAPGEKRPNLTRAQELLKNAVDVNAKDFQTLMSMGFAFKEVGNGGNAATYYEYAAAVEPKNPLPLLMLGKVYKAANQSDRAVEYFDKAIAANPRYTPALRAKAEHFYFTRKWENANKAYEALVAQGDAVTIEDEMQLANTYFIVKNCVATSDLVEKILRKDGSRNYLRRLQAYCDYENGEYQRGLLTLTDYFNNVTADKIIASDYEYLGKLQLKTNGDTAVAIGNLQKAIEVDTAHSRWALYEDIGNLQYVRKDYCGAASSLQLYLDSVATPTATNYFNLGLRYYFCNEDTLAYEKAATAFARVTEKNAGAAIGWLWRAKTASKFDPTQEEIVADDKLAKEYGKAREFYEQYIELEKDMVKNRKDFITAYSYLAYVYFVSGEADKFNAITAKWLELEPDNPTIKEMRAAFVPGGGSAPKSPSVPDSDGNRRN